MDEHNNTESQLFLPPQVVRVIRIELVMSKTNILRFIPSSFLTEVMALIRQADELELRFKIEPESKSG